MKISKVRLIAAITTLVLCVLCSAGCKGQVEWYTGTLEDAKLEAEKRHAVILLNVSADWCPSCNELENHFWNTRRGQKAGQRYVAMKMDYEKDSGRRVVKRYNVLHLPTTLVLDKDGTELGRVVGFEDAGAYAKRLEEIAGRPEPRLDVLEKRHAQRPDDLQTMLELGEAYLEAGLQKKGVTTLNRVLDRDPDNEAGVYLDATRILGRYFVRCGVDYYQGEQLFRKAVERFPDADEAWGFRHWIAQAMWDAGNRDGALEYLQELVDQHPDEARSHATRARFLQRQDQDLDTALSEIHTAQKLAPDDHWNHYVEAEILYAQDNIDAAIAALNKAISMADDVPAIYENRLSQWSR